MALHPEELFIVVLLFPQKVIDCLVSAKETLVSIERYSLSSISVRAPILELPVHSTATGDGWDQRGNQRLGGNGDITEFNPADAKYRWRIEQGR